MNKIDELIQKLCPNGVEYKSIDKICDVFTGGEPPKDFIKTKKPECESFLSVGVIETIEGSCYITF